MNAFGSLNMVSCLNHREQDGYLIGREQMLTVDAGKLVLSTRLKSLAMNGFGVGN